MDTTKIADALKRARALLAHTPGQRVGNADAALVIADEFLRADPSFDRAAFLEACGVYAYTGEGANARQRDPVTVSLLTVATGTFATVSNGRVESTVRLPNGTKRVSRDLEDLADAEESKAKDAWRRAERLRAAVAHLNAGKD